MYGFPAHPSDSEAQTRHARTLARLARHPVRHLARHWARHWAKHWAPHATGLLPGRVVVAGDSMRPALEPGDRLLVVPVRRPRPGHLVAIQDPRDPGRLLVKRVVAVDSDRLDVRGDNESASTDSRSFGTVARSRVVGRAVYRYAPRQRAGRVGR